MESKAGGLPPLPSPVVLLPHLLSLLAMVTTATTSPSPSPDRQQQDAPEGFVDLLVRSIFEPGVNPAVVMAMNISFLLLVITLFGLGFLTAWNKHVLVMIVASTVLWGMMMWFVMEISRVQGRSDNLPLADIDLDSASAGIAGQETATTDETRKDI
ncbi:hypothetical protein P7C73_g5127, partial [Tremellales sp. Uapishka_1]